MQHHSWATLVVCLLLAACAGTPTVPGKAAPAAAPAPAPPTVAPQLAAEQRWLEDLFRGTPVTVGPAGTGPDAPLKLEVPLKYSFDPGQATVKPPLGAVLDRVAASLARQPRARVGVAAPSAESGASVRGHLVAKGVAGYRIERLPNRADGVELRLRLASSGIERLEDPPPPAR